MKRDEPQPKRANASRLVVSVGGGIESIEAAILEAENLADLLEFRLDLFEQDDLETVARLMRLSSLPVIFTLRRRDQGGAFKGDETLRKKNLLAFKELDPAYIDLEWDCTFATHINVPLIASYHDMKKTPKNLERILCQMNRFPAAYKKIATFANSSIDALRMVQFVKKEKIAGMCMGERGAITRILGPTVHAPLVYASINHKTAEGQLSAHQLLSLYRFREVSEATRLYGLIGDPVAQSIGDLFHNQIFQRERENALYLKIQISQEELELFFKEMKALPFFGLSVTMPLKEAAILHADRIDAEADQIRAINTLTLHKGKWLGSNYDGLGATKALLERGKIEGRRILLLGTGGAAKAIAHSLKMQGGRLYILSRNFEKATALAKDVGGHAISESTLPGYDIIVNTTPPSADYSHLFEKGELKEKIIFDISSSRKMSKLMEIAKRGGATLVFGFEMYKHQAVAQLELWLKRKIALYPLPDLLS